MEEDNKRISKFKQNATYDKARNKLDDVVLVYEDKTYILFGPKKKKAVKGS